MNSTIGTELIGNTKHVVASPELYILTILERIAKHSADVLFVMRFSISSVINGSSVNNRDVRDNLIKSPMSKNEDKYNNKYGSSIRKLMVIVLR